MKTNFYINKVICEDSLEILSDIPNESIDSIITDPPYGYSFMGKDWDKAVPSVALWKECLRVLKAGSFCFVMSAPRQDVLSRMMLNLEKAGFKTNFTSIYWTYATGFPKAANIGKMVQSKISCGGASPQHQRLKRQGVEYKPTGQKDYRKGRAFENIPKDDLEINITHPKAKALNGSYAGFQPKPAVEVIIVCMKPLSENTYVDQVLANQKGITWLNNCRISGRDKAQVQGDSETNSQVPNRKGGKVYSKELGRFPANLLVSDGSLNRDQDKLSYSRYFDLDKWNAQFVISPKASKREKNSGGINNHPTVKPLILMRYLVTLSSRPTDIILDPFVGSGTTVVAAKELKRKYCGIDLSSEYCSLAQQRLKACKIIKKTGENK